jgi:hypothetical protein
MQRERALHKTPAERREHIDAIAAFMRDQDLWELHAWLHQNLTILDDKANSAFQLSAIALALLTIFAAAIGQDEPIALRAALVIPFLLLIWSIVRLSRLFFVYWSTTEEFAQPREMLSELLRVRDDRSRVVRSAWLRTVIAVIVFAVIAAIELVRGS